MTTYETVELADAREGDEVWQAGKWTPVAGVYVFGSRRDLVKIVWQGGGSHSGPIHHMGKARRPVVESKIRTLMRELVDAGFAPTWSNTGGNCMAVEVPVVGGFHFLITEDDGPFTLADLDDDAEVSGVWYVDLYDADGDSATLCQGLALTSNTDELVAKMRGALTGQAPLSSFPPVVDEDEVTECDICHRANILDGDDPGCVHDDAHPHGVWVCSEACTVEAVRIMREESAQV